MSEGIPQTSAPREADAIKEAMRAVMALLNVAIPARVISYDKATQTASVQPVIRGRRMDGDGVIESYQLPIVPNVPVLFPSSSGLTGAAYTYSPAVGDHGHIIWEDRSTDEWRSTASDDNTPGDLRRHDYMDAVFYPGGRSPADPLPAAAYDASGNPVLYAARFLYLGDSTATEFVALATKVLNELNTMAGQFNAHTHGGVTVGGGNTAGPTTAMAPASVAASKVKAV